MARGGDGQGPSATGESLGWTQEEQGIVWGRTTAVGRETLRCAELCDDTFMNLSPSVGLWIGLPEVGKIKATVSCL